MLLRRDDGYEIDTATERIDVPRIHRWLADDSYWAVGRPEPVVAASVVNSHCYGIYDPVGRQVGFARAVTDYATFAWICDVYIDRPSRGLGLGTWLARCLVDDLRARGVGRIVLATRDAHEVYRKAGFETLGVPSRWMEIDARGVPDPEREMRHR